MVADSMTAGTNGAGLPSLLIGFLALHLAGWNAGEDIAFPPAIVAFQDQPAPGTAPEGDEKELAAVRAAQRHFEVIRRLYLRRVPYVSGTCDEIIGRFCVWYDEEDWEPPPENPRVTRARRELLARLDVAARKLPSNAWILGQRVRYLVDAGEGEDAAVLAGKCTSQKVGWCAELAGFAYHAAGDFARADAAFAQALATLTPEEHCQWNDLTQLLEGRARKEYKRMGCEGRGAFEARFWWLADPLYLVPGNERRTEHYGRRVMDRLQDHASSGFGMPWGPDLREILIRFGWPAGWEATLGRPGLIRGASHLVAHDPPGVRHFLPALRWLANPGPVAEISEKLWDLEMPRPHTYYGHPLAREFGPMRVQGARFRRGDTAVVVAAFDASVDTLPPCDSMQGAVILSEGPKGPSVLARSSGEGDRSVLIAALPHAGTGALLGVEALCRSQGRAARVRYGLKLAGDREGPALSDLLLGRELARQEPRHPLPETLEVAAAEARTSLRVRRGERVPVYWEVYGAPRAQSVTVELGLTRAKRSALRKATERLRLTRKRPSVSLRWKESPPEVDPWRRSVVFVVPEKLSKGLYVLEIAVNLAGRSPLRSSRIVEVEGR